jgi:rod shape determining protein RodA
VIPRQVDRFFLVSAVVLLAVSVSVQIFLDRMGGRYGVMQMLWAVAGLVLFYTVALGIEESDMKRLAVPAYGMVVAALALVLFFGTGAGSNRWFRLGPISVQPSEFGKPVLAVLLAWLVYRMEGRFRVSEIWITMGSAGALMAVLVFLEPDLGTALLYGGLTVGAMLGIREVRWRHVAALALVLIIVATAGFFSLKDYQKQRILEFLEGHRGGQERSYQVAQALVVFGSGGITGRWFTSESLQVVRYLPARRTDFVMATAGHMFGLVGSALVMTLLFGIPVRMFLMRRDIRSTFGGTVLLNLGIYWLLQTGMNLGVALNLLPVTGIPLPLLSYGGSGVISNMLALGIASSFTAEAEEGRQQRERARQPELVRPRL